MSKDYKEVRSPYLSAACKPNTSIAAHVIVYCDCGTQVDIIRYYGSGRCRIFLSGTVDDPEDEMTIYSSLRRLPASLSGFLDASSHSQHRVISCMYDSSALHLIHYGSARFWAVTVGAVFHV